MSIDERVRKLAIENRMAFVLIDGIGKSGKVRCVARPIVDECGDWWLLVFEENRADAMGDWCWVPVDTDRMGKSFMSETIKALAGLPVSW